MHVSCTAPAGAKGTTAVSYDRILEHIGTRAQWSYIDLKTSIMELLGIADRTAKYKITDLISLKKLVKNDNSTYSLTKKEHAELPEWVTN
jgi:hypothetical protein